MLSARGGIGRLKGELFWVLAGHAASFAGGLIGIRLFTGMLGTDGYGRLALGLTVAGLLTTFLHNPLSNSVTRFYTPYLQQGKLLLYFTLIRSLHKKLLLLLIPVSLLLLLPTLLLLPDWLPLAGAGLLFGMTNGIYVTCLCWLNAARERKNATLLQIADVWLRIGAASLLLCWLPRGELALIGYSIGTATTLLWQHLRVKKVTRQLEQQGERVQLPEIKGGEKEFIHFATPFTCYAIFTIFTLYADRWIVQFAGGTALVGGYAAMYQLAASPANILFAVINQLCIPIIYEKAGGDAVANRQQIRKTLHLVAGLTLAILLLAAVPLYLLAPWLTRTFTAAGFAPFSGLILPLFLGMGLFQLGQFYTLEGNCLNRPNAYYIPKLLHALLLLLGGIWLTRLYGAAGMAWSGLIASCIYLLLIPLINRRLLPV